MGPKGAFGKRLGIDRTSCDCLALFWELQQSRAWHIILIWSVISTVFKIVSKHKWKSIGMKVLNLLQLPGISEAEKYIAKNFAQWSEKLLKSMEKGTARSSTPIR